VAIATYDPQTGKYATPDGKVFTQPALASDAGAGQDKTWQDMLPTGA
jgi:hypothetical protein